MCVGGGGGGHSVISFVLRRRIDRVEYRHKPYKPAV